MPKDPLSLKPAGVAIRELKAFAPTLGLGGGQDLGDVVGHVVAYPLTVVSLGLLRQLGLVHVVLALAHGRCCRGVSGGPVRPGLLLLLLLLSGRRLRRGHSPGGRTEGVGVVTWQLVARRIKIKIKTLLRGRGSLPGPGGLFLLSRRKVKLTFGGQLGRLRK